MRYKIAKPLFVAAGVLVGIAVNVRPRDAATVSRNYSVADLLKHHFSVSSNEIVRLYFSEVKSIKGHSTDEYEVRLAGETSKHLSVIVGKEGLKFFETIEREQQAAKRNRVKRIARESVYCRVESSGSKRPQVYCLGSTTYKPAGGTEKIRW